MANERIIIFVDMDDTIADFIGSEKLFSVGLTHSNSIMGPLEMYERDFFRNLLPIRGALDGVRRIINIPNVDVYILSKPVHDSPHSYSEKCEWIREHLPELSDKIILTQRKELCMGHFLIDDSISWKDPWEASTGGRFIHFNPRGDTESQWLEISELLKELASKL